MFSRLDPLRFESLLVPARPCPTLILARCGSKENVLSCHTTRGIKHNLDCTNSVYLVRQKVLLLYSSLPDPTTNLEVCCSAW